MNRQKLNKILMGSMVVIWSFVGYMVVSRFFGNTPEQMSNQHLIDPVVPASETRTAFLLKEIDRDPFLGTYKKPKVRTTVSTKKVASRNAIKRNIPWPIIDYFGYVQNENNKNPLVLVSINDKLKRIRKGANVEGLVIQKVYKDSIVISKGRERQTFYK